MAASNQKSIVIDLDIREEAGARGPGQLIQREAVNIFKTLLHTVYKAAKRYKKDSSYLEKPFDRMRHRVYNTITLHGSRGSGKTTLLNSLIQTLRSPNDNSNEKLFTDDDFSDDSPLGGVYALDVIDPGLVETKEHVLITIIGMMKYAVEKHLDKASFDKNRRAAWADSLTSLSEGLTRLDGIGSPNPHEAWDDALYITQKGLQGAQGSIVFETALATFVRQSLDILGKDLFLIAFDDIDTAIDRGFDVIENIRKYLATPLILIVIGGDLDLYSKIIRLEYWRKFQPKEIPPAESDIYLKKINELEDQYMMKLLKPANRIELLSLDTIFNRGNASSGFTAEIAYTKEGKQQKEPLIEFINRAIASVYGISRTDQVALYRSLILRQPARMALDFLRAFAVGGETANIPSLTVVRRIAEIAQGPLLRNQLSVNRVADTDPKQMLLLIRDYLNRKRLWVSGYRLHPDIHDEHDEFEDETNLVILSLAAAVMHAIRTHPAMIFDYFIQLCLPHSALEYVPQKEGRITQYLDFVSGKSFEDSRTEARQNVAVVFWKQYQEKSLAWAVDRGVIRVVVQNNEVKAALSSRDYKGTNFWQTVNRDATKNSTDSVRVRWDFNTIEYLTGEKRLKKGIYRSATMRDVAQLPFAEVIDQQSHSFTLCSVLNILGVLAEIAEETWATTDVESFADSFSKFAQFLSFPVPNWTDERGSTKPGSQDQQDQDETIPDSDENDVELGNTEDANRNLLSALQKWTMEFTQTIRDNSSINVHLLARVWSRFYFTLLRIGESAAKKDMFLNWLLHRQIVAFLSAALIEEMHDKSAKPYYENPTGDDRSFLINVRRAFASDPSISILDAKLKSPPATAEDKSEQNSSEPNVNAAIGELKAKYPLFYTLFSCPLWACYLNPTVRWDQQQTQSTEDASLHLTLLELQILHWAKWLPEVANAESVISLLAQAQEVLQVGYAVTTKKTHVFPNLYDLLSSIPVASGIPRKS